MTKLFINKKGYVSSCTNEFMNEDFYFQQKTWKEIYMNVYFSSTCNKLFN